MDSSDRGELKLESLIHSNTISTTKNVIDSGKATKPIGCILDIKDTIAGRSYVLKSISDIKIDDIFTSKYITITEEDKTNYEDYGLLDFPYYLVRSAKNIMANPLDAALGTKSEEEVKVKVGGGGAKSPENIEENAPIPGGANREEIIANKFHVFFLLKYTKSFLSSRNTPNTQSKSTPTISPCSCRPRSSVFPCRHTIPVSRPHTFSRISPTPPPLRTPVSPKSHSSCYE